MAQLADQAREQAKMFLIEAPDIESAYDAQIEKDIDDLFGEKKVDTETGEITEKDVVAEDEAEALSKQKPKPESEGTNPLQINMEWLTEAMTKIKWTEKTATSFIKSKPEFQGIDTTGTLGEVLSRMSEEQQEQFTGMVQELEALS